MSAGRTSTIGPYRLEDRLGAGGMGEVWRAWDERLDRSVAVKLIRPESAEDHTARERFRREARAAAALTHPAVVRIYDIIESGEGDAIVMELVEGEPLSKRIARGPLPVEEAVRLGRQIAEGLDAAHRRGILHRDLKAENVIVTPEGEAKILDFGLAKRLEGDAEASLTRSTGIVGTFRAMSPEQARGMTLDHRSDLFSFGVLLYEMLTGASPFKAESATDTLMRICTMRQRPVQELRPEVPEELSALIDQLLDKDPALRPRGAGEVTGALRALQAEASPAHGEGASWTLPTLPADAVPAGMQTGGEAEAIVRRASGRLARRGLAALAILAAVLAVIWIVRLRREEPLYVAVPVPEVVHGHGDERVDLTESALRSAVLDGLLSFDAVYPLGPDQVENVVGDLVQIARALAADELITSRLSCGTELCEVVLGRVRGTDGSLLWTATFQAPVDRPDLLVEAVQGHLLNAYSDREVDRGTPWFQVRPSDYAEYLRLARDFDGSEEEERPVDEILARLEKIRAGSPRFLAAYIFETEVLEYRFRARRDPGDLERAFRTLARAREMFPGDQRPVQRQISLAMTGGQLGRAEEALQELERLEPGDARLLAQRARLLDRRGETAEAVHLMETAARRLPLWRHLFWAGSMRYRLGQIPAARRHLEDVLERAPDNYVVRSKLAEIELMNGSPERAADLYAELVQRSPEYGELTNLGLALCLLRRYAEAEERYRQALQLAPDNPLASLNLADALLLGGKRAEAEERYQDVLRVSSRDPAAATDIQILSVRAQALAHLGRSGEAVQVMQEALRLAPENPQTAYEAAVVYVVLGDKASARYHAERALAQGFERRWFTFPWFRSLQIGPPHPASTGS